MENLQDKHFIPVYVFRTLRLGDCTNGGISRFNDCLYLECSFGFKYSDYMEGKTIRLIKNRNNDCYCEPLEPVKHGNVGYMFGGNYICTSDSRFYEITGTWNAVRLHDRQETVEEYDFLSR